MLMMYVWCIDLLSVVIGKQGWGDCWIVAPGGPESCKEPVFSHDQGGCGYNNFE